MGSSRKESRFSIHHPLLIIRDDAYSVSVAEDDAAASIVEASAAERLSYSQNLVRKVAAEILGTFVLVLFSTGAVLANRRSDGGLSFLGIAFASGFTVMAVIFSVGHISGAHVNPAVTIAFAAARHFPLFEVPFYIAAQITGSTIASFAILIMYGTPRSASGLLMTRPTGGSLQALLTEIVATFFMMFMASAVATDTRAVGELAGIAVGATVFLDTIVAGPISGASMNPVRSLGPAIAANVYDDLWIYFLGPLVGAMLASLSYNLLRLEGKVFPKIMRMPILVPNGSKAEKDFVKHIILGETKSDIATV